MAWILLFVAGMFEVVWAFAMKHSDGFTKPGPTAITVIMMVASFALLSLSMRTLPLGTAYTVWSGIGAIGTFIVGILVFGEQLDAIRTAGVVLIVAGMVLMKLSSVQ
jgi:quaternary ammonium compound-resistance protein SugE